jgi:hypothetical protein
LSSASLEQSLADPGDWADDKKELMFVKVVTRWMMYGGVSSGCWVVYGCGNGGGMRHPQPLCMVALVLVLSSPVTGGDAVSMADVPSAAHDTPLAAWALDLLSETRDRPLFSLRRRPPPPPALPPPEFAAQAPEPPPPTIVLLAIVSEDGVAHAVVRTAEHKAICARLGSEIAGWKVTHIEPRRLALSFGDRVVSFAMFTGMNGKSAKSREPEPASPDVQMQNVAQRGTDRRIGRQ